ncbi:MAG: alpha/beta fold hydrolase [Chloroflexi bacterium]|nr:alpha/beta fold hydrolase [Chloroflexota bacterium]
MSLFRRAIRALFLLAGVVAGLIAVIAALFARELIRPTRKRLWVTPGELGLPYDNVQFPALDGIRLSGWFIPAPADSQRTGATIIMVHGWMWNRLGSAADDSLSRLSGALPVELLRLAFALHKDGFNVLMFDERNHGDSAAMPPFTFGSEESKDLLGALDFVKTCSEADEDQIGVIGFSAGGNTLLYTLPQTKDIKAGIAVQPTTPTVFSGRYGRNLLGPLSMVIVPLAEIMYRLGGGRPFADYHPGAAAAHAGNVPILYVQGNGDPWGSAADVAQMAVRTPNAVAPLYVEATSRYEGYQYLVNNPQITIDFFERHL